MSNWLDSLRADLDAEMTGIIPYLRDVWKEVSTAPVQPSPQEEVDAWMQMPQEQVAQLAQQLGPEAFTALVQDKMQKVADVFDPATANTLAPYFLQHANRPVEAPDMMAQYGLVDDVPPLDLESEIDRFLVEELEDNP